MQPDTATRGSKKRIVLIIIAVLAAVLIAATLLAWRANRDNANDAAEAYVTITAGGANPETIQIAPGQSITWVNESNQVHKLEADQEELEEFNIELAPGDSFNFTFEDAGTYTYLDSLLSDLKGTVIVE